MIKTFKTITAIMTLLISTSAIVAVEDTSTIDLEFTHTEYVNLIGTAVGASRFWTVDDVQPVGNRRRGPRVSIGTLGLESNATGDCELDFSTQNNFRLRHTVTNQRLSNFRLRFRGTNITRRRNRQMTVPCNFNPRNFQFQTTGNFRQNPQAGVYQDIITVTVTTQ